MTPLVSPLNPNHNLGLNLPRRSRIVVGSSWHFRFLFSVFCFRPSAPRLCASAVKVFCFLAFWMPSVRETAGVLVSVGHGYENGQNLELKI